MDPTSGRNGAAVTEQLWREAFGFDFFQAVRLLQRMGAEAPAGAPGRRHPVGLDYLPRQEAVRFRALASHSFPTGAISEIRPCGGRGDAEQTAGPPPEMITSFLGLTGPNGALPQHYTALLIARVRAKDFALRDFLDVFNHRLISLYYRAWEKYRFSVAYERQETAEPGAGEDLFTACLYSLVGLGTRRLRRRLPIGDEVLLYYAGHFAHAPRSALSLEIMLGDYFELPVRIAQFQGQWLYLGRAEQSCLPSAEHPRGRNSRLGVNVVIGERVWDVESKFRVRLGALGYEDFCRFLPSGDALRPLVEMVRAYVGPQFDFDVQPVLKAGEVPWCRLGGAPAEASRLGWNTWVRAGPSKHDADDAVFSLPLGLPTPGR